MMDATDWGSFGGARLGREHQPLLALCTLWFLWFLWLLWLLLVWSVRLVLRRGLSERREGVGKEDQHRVDREAHLQLHSKVGTGQGMGQARGRRDWVRARKNVPILPHGTALCWESRAALRCEVLWALGHCPRAIKEGNNRTTRRQSTQQGTHARPGQTR